MFIGLNPSTADEVYDDPTIRRCINYSRSWGYGGVYMMNLFSYVSTQPLALKKQIDSIGLENDEWLLKISKKAGLIIGAWGNHGDYLNRSNQIIDMIPKIHCLKMNKTGQPAHPLYQRLDLKPKLISKN